ncbi:small cysteine and glycine repeat-containing protein 2 [Drosophila ficusphila]|uniref:small cysteine and glycine repeat-containing protein 2 n=1 Tax=Drosophila ficusphila TaxID=30025 RepID=UPI0007E7DA76|nr:small cysteine and glycine repeat-containing protein 2 [Drosophila ficusphila]
MCHQEQFNPFYIGPYPERACGDCPYGKYSGFTRCGWCGGNGPFGTTFPDCLCRGGGGGGGCSGCGPDCNPFCNAFCGPPCGSCCGSSCGPCCPPFGRSPCSADCCVMCSSRLGCCGQSCRKSCCCCCCC